jgi:cell division protein FtsW (lipid II flippase)
MATKFFHGVDLAVVIASTLALEVVTAIAVLISVVAPITIVVTVVPDVAATSKVIAAAVVAVVVASWRVRCFAGALVQQLLSIVGICVLLGGGEEVDHHYRPFTKELVPEIVVVAQTSDEGFNSLVVGDIGNPDVHI